MQALKQAALNKLEPKKAKRAVVLAEEGSIEVVSPKKLTKTYSVALLDKLVPQDDPKSNVNMQWRVRERMRRAGVAQPTVTIRFHHLSVNTKALIGDNDLPTLPHAVQHMLLSWLEPRKPLSIIEDASGILYPGRFTLILGPPSSGKTTFMKALVGRYRSSKDLKTTGTIDYNGKTFDEFYPERCAGYINQVGLLLGLF